MAPTMTVDAYKTRKIKEESFFLMAVKSTRI